MIIVFHKSFTKDFQKLSSRAREKFQERLLLLEADQFSPVLNNHALNGKYLGHRSINVTGDLRAIFKKDGNNITFVSLDSHSNLYG